MIPNNIYYRRIAQILNSTEYEHFYSSLYYMKRIAQSFGETYTGFNPSNKYLKDWALARGVTDDGEHHINRYWLHKIALTYDNSTLAGKTDNYYLKKIYDRLNESPVASTIKIYIDNVEVDPSVEQPVKILSKVDDDSATYKLEVLDNQGNPYEGYSIPITVGGVAVTPTPVTNAEGIVEYTYQSQGVGDTNISINCTLVSKTYTIHDDLFYDSMIDSIKNSWTKTSNQMTLSSDNTGTTISIGDSASDTPKLLYNLNSDTCIVEFDYISGTGSQQSFGFRVENSSHNYTSYLGYYGNKYRFGANSGSEKQITTSAPSNNHMKLEITPTSHKFYIDDTLIEEVTPSNSTTSKYIGFYMGYGLL